MEWWRKAGGGYGRAAEGPPRNRMGRPSCGRARVEAGREPGAGPHSQDRSETLHWGRGPAAGHQQGCPRPREAMGGRGQCVCVLGLQPPLGLRCPQGERAGAGGSSLEDPTLWRTVSTSWYVQSSAAPQSQAISTRGNPGSCLKMPPCPSQKPPGAQEEMGKALPSGRDQMVANEKG